MIVLKVVVMIVVILGIIIYMFPLALVQGSSMYPTLKDNEVLVMRRVLNKSVVKLGKIYVYTKPEDDRLVIKRLSHFNSRYGCFFLGDNPEESYDSRDYGYVKAENIKAVLLWNSKYQLKSKGEK